MAKDGTDIAELASETTGTSPEQSLCWQTRWWLASGDPARSRAPVATNNLGRAG
jgi:hypothetical protein